MDTIDPIRFIAALIFVFALIGVCALLLRRYGAPYVLGTSMTRGTGRVRVVERCYLDAKRTLVLVRCDAVEYFLLLADGRELLLEKIEG